MDSKHHVTYMTLLPSAANNIVVSVSITSTWSLVTGRRLLYEKQRHHMNSQKTAAQLSRYA